MRKMIGRIFLCFLAAAFFRLGAASADRRMQSALTSGALVQDANIGECLVSLGADTAECLEEAVLTIRDPEAAKAYFRNAAEKLRFAGQTVSAAWENGELPAGQYCQQAWEWMNAVPWQVFISLGKTLAPVWGGEYERSTLALDLPGETQPVGIPLEMPLE